uniref:Uncharacterized protein n=1 Tax=Anopheles farauti TaxID=69004 RepID=A0A182QWZ1_9DIPT
MATTTVTGDAPVKVNLFEMSTSSHLLWLVLRLVLSGLGLLVLNRRGIGTSLGRVLCASRLGNLLVVLAEIGRIDGLLRVWWNGSNELAKGLAENLPSCPAAKAVVAGRANVSARLLATHGSHDRCGKDRYFFLKHPDTVRAAFELLDIVLIVATPGTGSERTVTENLRESVQGKEKHDRGAQKIGKQLVSQLLTILGRSRTVRVCPSNRIRIRSFVGEYLRIRFFVPAWSIADLRFGSASGGHSRTAPADWTRFFSTTSPIDVEYLHIIPHVPRSTGRLANLQIIVLVIGLRIDHTHRIGSRRPPRSGAMFSLSFHFRATISTVAIVGLLLPLALRFPFDRFGFFGLHKIAGVDVQPSPVVLLDRILTLDRVFHTSSALEHHTEMIITFGSVTASATASEFHH